MSFLDANLFFKCFIVKKVGGLCSAASWSDTWATGPDILEEERSFEDQQGCFSWLRYHISYLEKVCFYPPSTVINVTCYVMV